MPHQVKAVVARSKGAPVSVETINVPDPGPGEALVQVQACGVCHTDLHYREGGINDDFPFLLGHEASGVVEAVGEGVTGLEPGDFVVLNWRAVCGSCRACLRGEPWYCFATFNATQKMTLEDGTELSPALGIGAFAEKTLVAAGQCTKVDPSARPAAVGLLGCGVMAGLGAAINTGNVTRGKSVAVIGCGGVGAAAVAGSVLAGAGTVIAVDIDDRKLEGARKMGATHTVNSTSQDPVEAIQALTGGHGADVVIDAVGRPETWKQGFYARDLAGTLVLVGVPTPDMRIPDIPLDRRLRPRRRAQVQLVRRLPADPRLPAARRPLPAGPARPRRVRDRGDRDRRGRGGVREDARRQRAALGRDLLMTLRVDHAVTSGTFSLDGQTFDVDNNVWVVGDDAECVVIDAPHSVDDILAVVGDRKVKAIICTHAHDDHVRVAPALREATVAPILLHPDDRPLWELTHTDYLWDVDLADDQTITVAGEEIRVLHTPGHAPGAVCLYRTLPRLRLHRRHAVRGRAGRDRAVVQRRRPDQGVDPGPAVRAARRHRRAHRPRPRHHDRRRAGEPRRAEPASARVVVGRSRAAAWRSLMTGYPVTRHPDDPTARRPSRSTSNPATSEPSVPRVMSSRVSS